MKKSTGRILLIVFSVIVLSLALCSIASAATIESPTNGAAITKGNAVSITVKPGVTTSRVDYIWIHVYDENNNLVSNYDASYEGMTTVKTSFVPKATGKYTIKTNTYYKVKTDLVNMNQESGKGDEITINVVDIDSIQSNRPTIKATTNCSGKVTLKISGNAAKYTVYRATTQDGTYKKLGTTSSGTYSDTTAGQRTYYYKVRGSALIGGKTYYSKYSYVTKVNAKITAFKADVSVELDGSYAKIIVHNSPKAAGYKYYRATSVDGTYKLLKTTTKSTFIDETVGSKTYYYKVLPYAVVNDSKVTGKYSEPVKFTAANPNKPGKPVITVTQAYYIDGTAASGCFLVNFNKVKNADTYKLYMSTDGGNTYKYDASGWYILKDSDIQGDSKEWWQRETVGKTYYFKLAASSKDFQNGEYEVFSDPVSYTVK